MRYLFVIDLQREFVKDTKGRSIYQASLDYIAKYRGSYDSVFACIYINKDNINMQRLVHWDEMKEISDIEFQPDTSCMHSGYSSGPYEFLKPEDTVDVIGFDTDASILSTCFDLFNQVINFNVLIDYCWSSGGRLLHNTGLAIMQRQFPGAIKHV